ncbi:MAG TPA: hypothetical protein VK203_10975 [Nostocaceae cyanobacterium]|nr:hypothetical protein [Nostocaceae cyanobacterium]
MKTASFPCWLTGKNKAIAEALLRINFCYCGLEDDFCESDVTWKCEGWKLGTSAGLVHLDAVYDGALFSRCLETEDGFEPDEKKYFDDVLKQVKKTIRNTAKDYTQSKNHTQLKLAINL